MTKSKKKTTKDKKSDDNSGELLLNSDDGELLLGVEEETDDLKSELLAEIEEAEAEVVESPKDDSEGISFDAIAIAEEKKPKKQVDKKETPKKVKKSEKPIETKPKKSKTPTARIAFDKNFNERGKINDSYSELNEFLTENEYQVIEYTDMLMQMRISKHNILVLACPDASKLNPYEINQIKRFVRNGGGLLLLSHAGGDHGRGTNINELAKEFGIHFENNQVLDEMHNYGLDTFPIINTFIDHPIITNVQEICLRAGCSVATVDPAKSVAFADVIADPTEAAIVGVSELDNGRVVAIGAYEMFRNEVLQWASHKQFIYNIFQWLLGDNFTRSTILQSIDSFVTAYQKLQKKLATKTDRKAKRKKPGEGFQMPVLAPITSRGGLQSDDLQIIIDGFNDVLKVTQDLKSGFDGLKEEFDRLKLEIKDDIADIKGFNTGMLRDLDNIRIKIEDSSDSGDAVSKLLMDLGKKVDKILKLNKKSK